MTNYNKGVLLVLSTAFISGLAIFINKFGVSGIGPNLFVGLKNLLVGVVIIGLILISKNWREVARIKSNQWWRLILIGLVGGSVPFLLFFNGLAQTSGAKAGFIHKSLFIYVALLAAIFLKEKLTGKIYIGVAGLLVGLIIFLNIKPQILNWGDGLILLATLMWAVEIIISKRLLKDLSASIVAGARMLFGGIIIWGYLLITSGWQQVMTLSGSHWGWLLITALFLTGYVLTFYHGLKKIPSFEAAAILALGAPITLILQAIWSGATISNWQLVGIAIILVSIIGLIKLVVPWKLEAHVSQNNN